MMSRRVFAGMALSGLAGPAMGRGPGDRSSYDFYRYARHSDDSAGLRDAAEALSEGRSATLFLPPAGGRGPNGHYLLGGGGFDINNPPGAVKVQGGGMKQSVVMTDDLATQNPFVLRNTVHACAFVDFGWVCAAKPSSFQHGPQFMNVSNSQMLRLWSKGAMGYGASLTEDVRADHPLRTSRACDNIKVLHCLFEDASQYGLQGFPKVLSTGYECAFNTFRDCGRNVQGWSLDQILPSALKVGQATRQSRVHHNLIVCAPGAAGLDIGNYEDIEVFENEVRGAASYFAVISASRHAALYTPSYAARVGGATPRGYVTGHARVTLRNNRFITGAVRRTAPAVAFHTDAHVTAGRVEIVGNVIEGDNFGLPSLLIRPKTTLTGPIIVGNEWRGGLNAPAQVMLLTNDFGGVIVAPRIEKNTARSDNRSGAIVRLLQLEGVVDASVIGNTGVNTGENAFDLRGCSGLTVLKDNVVESPNRSAVRGAAIIAISGDADPRSEYRISGIRVRQGAGLTQALVSSTSARPRLVVEGTLSDAPIALPPISRLTPPRAAAKRS